eukprot:4671741-Prorocentrum_lima.AAC.1
MGSGGGVVAISSQLSSVSTVVQASGRVWPQQSAADFPVGPCVAECGWMASLFPHASLETA